MWGCTIATALFTLVFSGVSGDGYHIPLDFNRNEAYNPLLNVCTVEGQHIPVGKQFLTRSSVCTCWYNGAVCHRKKFTCEHDGHFYQVGDSFDKGNFECFCYLDGLFCRPKPGYEKSLDYDYDSSDSEFETPQSTECGLENLDNGGRVVGGEETIPHQYPWLAYLKFQYLASDGSGYFFRCTGSLINDHWILTAAHCMSPEKVIKGTNHHLNQVHVFLGAHNTDSSGVKYVSPAHYIISHPSYNRATKQHDIGLIKLTSRAKFSNKIRPICLPTGAYGRSIKDNGGMRVTISGWGRIEENQKTNVPYKASMNSLPIDVCSKFYLEKITSNMFCTSSDEARQCKGDSGGPIFYPENNKYVQVGVVSFSKKIRKLCLLGIPAVQTFVPNYMPWIEETIRTKY